MEKKDLNVIFSHKSDEWSTPQWLFKFLDKKYNFTLDAAANHYNHKCLKYYTIDNNGLSNDWKGETVFINPPYSKIYEWVKKAAAEALNNETVTVMLLPARTDTKWFHEFCLNNTECIEITFIKGRLRFGDQKNSAPFPSMIVVFGKSSGVNPIIKTMSNKVI